VTKFKLSAGAELDLLSPDDLDRGLDPVVAALRKLSAPPMVRRDSVQITADASGNVASRDIVRARPGTLVKVNRIIMTGDGATPTAPNAPMQQGWIGFYRAAPSPSTLQSFVPVGGSTTVLPAMLVDGDGAVELHDGEVLVLAAGGLVANTVFTVNVQYRQWDTPEPPTTRIAD